MEYLGATDIQLVSHSIYRLSSKFDVNRSVVELGVEPLFNNCLFGTWTKMEKQPEIVTERGHEGTSEVCGISFCLLMSIS